jgi:hypothetical protein
MPKALDAEAQRLLGGCQLFSSKKTVPTRFRYAGGYGREMSFYISTLSI